MKKIYQTRTSFVIEVLKKLNKSEHRKILDVGFIGTYNKPYVHYEIIKNLNEDDILIGIDINKKEMDKFLKLKETKKYQLNYNLKYEVKSRGFT
ncbi:MAG: hypothetical protein ACTSRP_24780 [Candidatus Helarchaeota archaeon]